MDSILTHPIPVKHATPVVNPVLLPQLHLVLLASLDIFSAILENA